MSSNNELQSIVQWPHQAAQQMIIELIRAGAFNGARPADHICKDFDTLHEHFNKVKDELISK